MKHHVQLVALNNGAKGLIIDTPDAPVFGMEVNFRAGDYLTPKGKWEVAHILEHMVLGANKSYPTARAFGAEFQKNGAYKNASTGAYNLNYILESADFEWQRILPLSIMSIESPLLTLEEFNAESGNVREELISDMNQYFRQLIIKSREHFGFVAKNDAARLEEMKNIEIEDIRQYYKRTHTTNNMRFVIAGDVGDHVQDITDKLESIAIPNGERFALPVEKPSNLGKVHYIEQEGLQTVYFLWQMFAGGELSKLDRDALAVVNTMLTATLHSRILGEARERGLLYHISSNTRRIRGQNQWWFGAEVSAKNASAVFEIMQREIKRLLDGIIDDADIEAARNFMLGTHQRSLQTVQSTINGYAGSFFFDDTVEDHYAIPERLNAVTKERMLGAVQKMIEDKQWGLSVMASGEESLANSLQQQISEIYS